jgi:hypothetical protein
MLRRLSDIGGQWGFTPADVQVLAIHALKALAQYGDIDAAKAAVRTAFVTDDVRALDGSSMREATGASPRNAARMVSQVCRLVRPDLLPAPPRIVPGDRTEVEADTAGQAGSRAPEERPPASVHEVHTETWCPTASASVLLGPDRRCPGCQQTLAPTPRRRWRRRARRVGALEI